MFAFNFKLFRAKRNRHLKRLTWIAHDIFNYFLGWQRTRYSLGLPYLSYKEMSRAFTILRKSHPEIFAHWRELDSWAARRVLKRLDEGYQRFFNKIAKRPPKFRSWRNPYSFTMGPSGFEFADPEEGDLGFGIYGDKVRIIKRQYRFNLSRPILGNIKTVTVKADALGDFYMSVVTDHIATEATPKTGQAAGYDFGIKTMLTCSDGTQRESPHFYSTAQSELKSAQQKYSSKVKGSNNRERERKNVARVHRKTKRHREDHHWKLAKSLVHQQDILCFETLCFEGMKRLWGRKVSDIAPYAFHQKLRHQAKKHGKQICYIDRFEPTSKTCSTCRQTQMFMDLSVRHWRCQGCKTKHHRDVNAAINILKVGTSTFGLEGIRLAIASNPRRLHPKSIPHNPTAKQTDSL
ncbi:transposase [Candidatus Poribacteria bacterium]|nr:MAG: transposase [Candidatus Poribacteria bacterium]